MADRRAAEFGAVAAALWAAHDLADHVVQTDHQAARKATSWRALEVTGSPGFARPVTAAQQVQVVYGEGLPHVELSERPVPLHGPYLADQALHHTVLAVCAAILCGGRRG